MNRVAVGMSGGVDSSVAAAILVEQGHDVTGVYIEAYNEPGCRADDDKRDAIRVASQLGIRFQVLDLREQYKETVIKYFFDEYREGRTPNPDIVCNSEIKFGLFYDWACEQGFDKVATGHYARIVSFLGRPKDLTKDQTYFLWRVAPARLAQVIFPLGELRKDEVRKMARELELPNADKPDSMGVCMMGELNVPDFLKRELGEKPGEVVYKKFRTTKSSELIKIGTHSGLWFYTIGQRGGWRINAKMQTEKMPPLYVSEKDIENNRLVVGEREKCYFSEFRIQSIEFRINKEEVNDLVNENQLDVRIRNLGELVRVTRMNKCTNTQIEITTVEPIFAPAPGQSAVLYADDKVIGGGVIANTP